MVLAFWMLLVLLLLLAGIAVAVAILVTGKAPASAGIPTSAGGGGAVSAISLAHVSTPSRARRVLAAFDTPSNAASQVRTGHHHRACAAAVAVPRSPSKVPVLSSRWQGLRGTARTLHVAAACCAASALAGCATGPAGIQPPVRPSPPSPVASSTALAGDPGTLARRAYLGMWQAYVAAARTADYHAPTLDHYAAGGALSTLTHALYQEHQDGDVSLGQPVLHPVVTLVKGSGGHVTQGDVADCADSSHWLDYHGGKPVADQDLRHRYIIARLQPFDGTWKVTYLNVGLAGTC